MVYFCGLGIKILKWDFLCVHFQGDQTFYAIINAVTLLLVEISEKEKHSILLKDTL